MKRLLSCGRALLGYNFSSLLLFELFYWIGTFTLGLEAVRLLLNRALDFSGFSSLTAENYAAFLMNPATLAGMALGTMILLFFLSLQISALLACFHYSYLGQKIYINDLFFIGLHRTVTWMRRDPAGWLVLSFLAVPFLEGHFLIREVNYVKILQYTLQLFYQVIHCVPVLAASGILLFLLSYAALFSFPYIILEKEKTWAGFRRGWKLCKGRTGILFSAGTFVQAGSALLLMIFQGTAGIGAAVYTTVFKTPTVRIPSILVYKEWIEITAGLLAGAVGTVLGVLLVYTIYCSEREPVRTPARRKQSASAKASSLPSLKQTAKRKKMAAAAVFLFLLEISYVLYLAENKAAISDDLLAGTQITAHRGGAKEAPENTLCALAYAREHLADYAEIDVQETRDGVVVLLHDSNLKRTTGLDKNIWEVDYAELKKLDAGKYFGREYAGEPIPTLQEAIDFCQKSLKLNVEIKYNGRNDQIVEKVVRLFEENDLVETAILSSMNYRFLQEAKKLNPDIQTSYVMTMTYGSAVELIYADYVSVKYSYINQEYVEDAHRLGKSVHAWTLNGPWSIRRMHYYEVDNIITDDPAMARKTVENFQAENPGLWELIKYIL